jgi:hypothetical protein
VTDDKVLRFPVHRARSGGVFCPPLKIMFPTLYRVSQTVTKEQLSAFGVGDQEPVSDYLHYTLSDDDSKFAGTIERTAIRGISATDSVSVVIRHHNSPEMAVSYLEGIGDVLGDHDIEPIYRTEDGTFTMVKRPTSRSWKSPLVIYIAIHPADNIFGSDVWQVATSPDGETAPFDDWD